MEIIIGAVAALIVGISATLIGFDRDRAFYPTILVIIATYNGLFALMGASTQVLILETCFMAVFVVAAVLGFKSSLWLVVAALAAHGGFDLIHHHIIANPGVPVWWPEFCAAYDVVAAMYLAWLLTRSRLLVNA